MRKLRICESVLPAYIFSLSLLQPLKSVPSGYLVARAIC